MNNADNTCIEEEKKSRKRQRKLIYTQNVITLVLFLTNMPGKASFVLHVKGRVTTLSVKRNLSLLQGNAH